MHSEAESVSGLVYKEVITLAYLQESYESALRENERLLEHNKALVEALEGFVGKHFHGGSKANRSDYVAWGIPTADIYKLKEALTTYKGEKTK